MSDRYAVSIYVAAPGTPLRDGGTSAFGHVYYAIARGSDEKSYGFSPENEGAPSGPGKISNQDKANYIAPFYRRTLEIGQEQYEKLQAYGGDPEQLGFNMRYHGATNSCVDFVWGALNHAGLHRTTEEAIPDRDFDGALKPLDNIEHIRSIPIQKSGSDLNTEGDNDMPKQTRLQKLVSDAQLPEKERGMLETIRSQVGGIDRRYNRPYDDTSERISMGLLAVATEKGLERVDHVLLGSPPADGSLQRMFVVQGEPQDPAHVRASLPVQELAGTPVERSYERLGKMLDGLVPAEVAAREETRQVGGAVQTV